MREQYNGDFHGETRSIAMIVPELVTEDTLAIRKCHHQYVILIDFDFS